MDGAPPAGGSDLLAAQEDVMKKSKTWLVVLPGVHKQFFVTYERLVGEVEAKRGMRKWYGLDKLPQRTRAFPAVERPKIGVQEVRL